MDEHQGDLTIEVVEQIVFSLTNQLVKRNFYTMKEQRANREALYSMCNEYIHLYELWTKKPQN